jgi:predicted nucleic-acid-binding Zn-ribbon protein
MNKPFYCEKCENTHLDLKEMADKIEQIRDELHIQNLEIIAKLIELITKS